MTAPAWVKHAIWWHVYPLGFVGAFPADQLPRSPASIGWAASSTGSTTPWSSVRRASRWARSSPHERTATTPPTTTASIRASVTTPTSTAWSTRPTDVACGSLLDGVFNHVGTDFERYRQAVDGNADAAAWFRGRPGRFHTFEGHGELITLNHGSPQVVDYVVDVMGHWLDRGADGWRLDAAYAVPEAFWAQVLPRVRRGHPEAWFVAEVIHGDYVGFVEGSGVDSVTQYELWKAVWSSLNDGNFHELDWALQRHNDFLSRFAPQTFVGNHDVTRIASRLDRSEHLAHALVLLFTTGGVPTIYAGDELGYRGVKEERVGGDDAVRPEFGSPPSRSRMTRAVKCSPCTSIWSDSAVVIPGCTTPRRLPCTCRTRDMSTRRATATTRSSSPSTLMTRRCRCPSRS